VARGGGGKKREKKKNPTCKPQRSEYTKGGETKRKRGPSRKLTNGGKKKGEKVEHTWGKKKGWSDRFFPGEGKRKGGGGRKAAFSGVGKKGGGKGFLAHA